MIHLVSRARSSAQQLRARALFVRAQTTAWYLGVVVSHVLLWRIHHAQHGYATGPDKPNHQDGSQKQKENIEHTGVVPLYSLSDRNHSAIRWNNTKCLKEELDHIASSSHGDVERQQNIAHDAPAVIFAV